LSILLGNAIPEGVNPWNSLEVAKLAAACATPLVVTTIGLVLLRRVEGVKAQIASREDFRNKWAEVFFDTAHDYMIAVERTLALLFHLSSYERADPIRVRYETEVRESALTLSELELRIRRAVVFAPMSGSQASLAAKKIADSVSKAYSKGEGNYNLMYKEIDSFNRLTQAVHAELLGIPKR
jgi:hypothetical protein